MLYDNSLRKVKHKSDNENYDFKKELLKQEKINKDFLNKVKLLTLEELVYLKLDSISSSLNGKLMGIPIYKFLPEICKEALVRFAVSRTKNRRDACVMLGVKPSYFKRLIKKYDINLEKEK